jgi:Rap1 Myb domain
MIADHARRDAPPGTISWKFIDDSVKNGRLEDPEKYPAGPAAGFIRPVGAAQASRKVRTPFTPTDDLILAKWVLQKEAEGMLSRGNALYQDLEKLVSLKLCLKWNC